MLPLILFPLALITSLLISICSRFIPKKILLRIKKSKAEEQRGGFIQNITKSITRLCVFLLIMISLGLIFYLGFGFIKLPSQIIGDSMNPTLSNNEYLYAHPYYNFIFGSPKISRGDIIIFEDDKTNKKAYVKRVIGLPKDKIEIRNGFVYINGKILEEPYVSKYKSTYGGKFLSECKAIQVPEGYVFALGDNRIRSSDSREIGLVPESGISKILFYNEQDSFKNRWKINKKTDINNSLLNINDYVAIVNKFRVENNLKPLNNNSKLSKSALLRAEAMLKYDDLSWKATVSAYPMWKSMADAGYYNVTYGEYLVLGYYTADDLYAYETETGSVKDFLLNKDYQDIGIGSIIGNLNNCPVQLVVQQMAGYVPPNYLQSTIDSWAKSLDTLTEIQQGWQNLKQNSYFYGKYKSDIDRINDIISIRILNISSVVSTMRANKWLSSDLDEFTRTGDKALFNEQESIAIKLNNFK